MRPSPSLHLGADALVCRLDSVDPMESSQPSIDEVERHFEVHNHRTLRLAPGRWRRRHDRAGGDPTLPTDPVRAINQAVEDGGHDVVVVRQGSAWPPRWIRRLVLTCPCSILVQRSRPPDAVDVLAAVDIREEAGAGAVEVVNQARSIAGRLGGDTHLVHGWSPYDELGTRRVIAFTPAVPTTDAATMTRDARRLALDEFVSQVDGVDRDHAHLVQGPAADAVQSAADRHRFGLVVVGASRRTGIAGRCRVSTPIDVLGLVNASVLVVKPRAT